MMNNFDYNNIIAKYLENLTNSILDKTLKKALKAGKDFSEKMKIDLGIAFDKYIKNLIDKHLSIKTFLDTQPHNLIESFVPSDLEYEEKITRKFENSNELKRYNLKKPGVHTVTKETRMSSEFFLEEIINNKRLLLTGTSGSGKSTLLKKVIYDIVTQGDYIPIFISLKDLNVFT